MDLLSLLLWVSVQPPPAILSSRWDQRGIASVYYNGHDGKHAGGGLACLWKHPKGNHVDPTLRFVAHRTWPCGTVVEVYLPRTGKNTLAVVQDRGPYGAVHEGKWVLKVRRSDPGVHRGIVDLSPGTAEALGHNGWERVYLRRVQPIRP